MCENSSLSCTATPCIQTHLFIKIMFALPHIPYNFDLAITKNQQEYTIIINVHGEIDFEVMAGFCQLKSDVP